MSKFLLMLGVSGAGKSTIIEALEKMDERFVYVPAHTTRPLREGEVHKVHVTEKEMDEMAARGKFLALNDLYGVRYGTPRQVIMKALAEDKFPILDWPIDKMGLMRAAFPGQLYVVYVLPPSMEALRQRLMSDGRDRDGKRLRCAEAELRAYRSSRYAGICDLEVVSQAGAARLLANIIYNNYLDSFVSSPAL